MDDGGVTDVLGNILLVAITVASFTGLSLLVASVPPPPDPLTAELDIHIGPGADQSWGTGDERIVLRHLYGEPVPASGTRIAIIVNGVATYHEGAGLGFSNDRLDIGESWDQTLILNFNDVVEVATYVPHGSGSAQLTATTVITGQTSCDTDTTPPSAIITQTPKNVEATTGAAPVSIAVVLVDVCSGVDSAATPVLEHWFNDEPANAIIMTPGTTNQWLAEIPAPAGNWVTRSLSELKYRVVGMTDLLGNTGDSPTRVDAVDPIPPNYHYPTNITANVGSVTAAANLQNGTDGGAEASLAEGITGTGQTIDTVYGVAVSPLMTAVWDNPERALGQTNQEAKYKGAADPASQPLRIEMGDLPDLPNRILKVELLAIAYVDGVFLDDGFRLQACWTGQYVSGASCNTKSPVLTGSATPQTYTYDITDKRPGGGTWKWSDLKNIDLLASGAVVGGIRDGDYFVREVALRITHGPGYDMDQEIEWSGNLLPLPDDLEIRYRSPTGVFRVEVWDPSASAWNPRAELLGSPVATVWTTSLTAAEWQTGNPTIRIVSELTNPSSQATLYIDYARILS